LTRTRPSSTRKLGGLSLSPDEAGELLPQRQEFVAVWRYLVAHVDGRRPADELRLHEPQDRARRACSGSCCRTRICLDVFAEQGLILLDAAAGAVRITLT
jgi:hypothetical protein